jgi:hypothetical protein
MHSNIRLILVIVLVAIAIFIAISSVNARQAEWENNREIITVVVCHGDTLYNFAQEYKPSWMDAREYIYAVEELNNLDGGSIYAGQTIMLYTMGE